MAKSEHVSNSSVLHRGLVEGAFDGWDATCRVARVARGCLAGWVEAGGNAVFTRSIRSGYEEGVLRTSFGV